MKLVIHETFRNALNKLNKIIVILFKWKRRKLAELVKIWPASLVKQGYKITERNFWRKYGEIDIVAFRQEIIHFVEVKTVSREMVNHETLDYYRPEDNIHPYKLARLRRVIQVYLINRQVKSDWQFDVITVFYSLEKREARINLLENLIL